MIKKTLIAMAILIGGLVCAELAARGSGWGSPLLYEADKGCGYRVKPGQDIVRFGNRIAINEQGLRNGPIAPEPAEGVLRVLCVGDSITNGGEVTDQSKTYPQLLQDELRRRGIASEVLNASAHGWGIFNEVGFIKTRGIYHSKVAVLLLNDRDLLQEIQDPVEFDAPSSRREFPTKKPVLALQEIFGEIFFRLSARISKQTGKAGPVSQADVWRADAIRRGLLPADSQESDLNRLQHILWEYRLRVFDEEVSLLRFFCEFVRREGAVPIVAFLDTPKAERFGKGVDEGAFGEYKTAVEDAGGKFFYMTGAFKKQGYERLFKDSIHPNEEGNQVLAEAVANVILKKEAESQAQSA